MICFPDHRQTRAAEYKQNKNERNNAFNHRTDIELIVCVYCVKFLFFFLFKKLRKNEKKKQKRNEAQLLQTVLKNSVL